MSKQKVIILGHEVIIDNPTGTEEYNVLWIEENIQMNEKSGLLLKNNKAIGTWKIIDWKAIAGKLYKELSDYLEAIDPTEDTVDVMNEYEEAIKE